MGHAFFNYWDFYFKFPCLSGYHYRPGVFGGILTLLTLFITIINLYQSNDKFFKGLFADFNQRYDAMNNFLNQVKPDAPLLVEDRQHFCS